MPLSLLLRCPPRHLSSTLYITHPHLTVASCRLVSCACVCVVQPVVSGAAMALSSLCTVGSSLLLWLRYTPPALPKTDAGTRAPTRQMAVGRGKGRAAYNPLYSADVAKECAAERAR
jgi:hypothetical protein